MALATQCPHCGTMFRVASDQLKLRGGIVRCGACQEIFDGSATLIDLDKLAAQAPAALAAQPAPAASPSPAVSEPDTPAPAAPSTDTAAPEGVAAAPAAADALPFMLVEAEAGEVREAILSADISNEGISDDTPIYTLDLGHTFDPFGILPKTDADADADAAAKAKAGLDRFAEIDLELAAMPPATLPTAPEADEPPAAPAARAASLLDLVAFTVPDPDARPVPFVWPGSVMAPVPEAAMAPVPDAVEEVIADVVADAGGDAEADAVTVTEADAVTQTDALAPAETDAVAEVETTTATDVGADALPDTIVDTVPGPAPVALPEAEAEAVAESETIVPTEAPLPPTQLADLAEAEAEAEMQPAAEPIVAPVAPADVTPAPEEAPALAAQDAIVPDVPAADVSAPEVPAQALQPVPLPIVPAHGGDGRIEPDFGLPPDEELVAVALPDHALEHATSAPAVRTPDDTAPLPLRESSIDANPAPAIPVPIPAPATSTPAARRAEKAAARRSKLTPTKIEPQPKLRAPEIDEPDFVKRSRQQEQSGRTRKIAMLAGSLFLLLLLVVQGTYTFRNTLAAHFPALKPALVSSCALFGCRVELLARVDNLAIETGELTTLGGGAYSFTTELRNSGSTAQAWPSLELALTDANDKPLVRRVFAPRDYLGPNPALANGIAPRTEQAIKLHFRVDDLKPSGYHIAVFYP